MGCCLSLIRTNKGRQKDAVTLDLFPVQHSFQTQDGATVPVLEFIDFEMDPGLWNTPSNKLKFWLLEPASGARISQELCIIFKGGI